MPLVKGFERMSTTSGALQPTQVVARFKVFDRDGHGPIFQIETGGSEQREFPGKVSQTFQLNRDAALVLWTELGKAFNFGR